MTRPVLMVGPIDAEVRSLQAELDTLGVRSVCLPLHADLEVRADRRGITFDIAGEYAGHIPAGDRNEPPIRSVFVRGLHDPPSRPASSPFWNRETHFRDLFYRYETTILKLGFLRFLQDRGVPIYNALTLDSVEMKPYRLLKLAYEGMGLPATLYSQRPESVTAFCTEAERAIAKPVVGGAHVAEVTAHDLSDERLPRVKRAPVTFQELVRGKDVRVYVCRDRIIGALAIDSKREVDFRGAETGVREIEIRPEAAEMCLRACRMFGLGFAALDLRMADDGRMTLLEANNSPMFVNFESHFSTPRVTQSLARALAGIEG